MEYNKDEIIKEFRDWSKFRVQGVWKDSIEKLIIQFIEERLVKKLTLTDVSQQRELLIDYSNYLCKEYFDRHLEPDSYDVDEYIKSINCG